MSHAPLARAALLAAALTLAGTASGCSPEATRQRGGGPGADIGNHSRNAPEPSEAPLATYRSKGEPSGPGQKP